MAKKKTTRKKTNPKKKGSRVTYIDPKGKKNATYKVKRTKQGTFKKFERIAGLKRGMSIGSVPTYSDPIAAREIELYAINDSELYNRSRLPILKNLKKKLEKGTYKSELAAKLWLPFINKALMKYNKEFGSRGDKWSDLLSVADRKILAMQFARDTERDFKNGEFYWL
jgi:hypothetical protein